MFLGHFALAFAAKRLAPRTSLGTLFIAAQFADLLWPALLLLSIERVRIEPQAAFMPLIFEYYPVSHSLAALAVWAVVLGGIHYVVRRDLRAAAVIGTLVVSHWVLDAIVHRPDLPVYPGGMLVGLFLWSSPTATLALELLLFAIGLALFLGGPRPTGRTVSTAVLAGLLLLIYAADRFGGAPPPSVAAIAWVGQAQWLLVALAYWVDRTPGPHSMRPARSPG
jgi:hypothetical protein